VGGELTAAPSVGVGWGWGCLFWAAPPPRIYTRARMYAKNFSGEPTKARQARPAAGERGGRRRF
jgi:hypothetical protein